jgi:hypothetical protein
MSAAQETAPSSEDNNPHHAMTSNVGSPEKCEGPEVFKLLLLETEVDTLYTANLPSWKCTNGNGILVTIDQIQDIMGSSLWEYHGINLLDYLKTYLAQPSFKSW